MQTEYVSPMPYERGEANPAPRDRTKHRAALEMARRVKARGKEAPHMQRAGMEPVQQLTNQPQGT